MEAIMSAKRMTLGVLINGFDLPYQQRVCAGVEDAARELDDNVFFLNSGSLNSPFPQDRMRNILHRYVKANSFDGFFVVSTTVLNFTGPEALTDIFRDVFPHIPVVTIGAPSPGVSSFAIDNRSGVREAMRHLIEDHGRSRFVFVSGLGDNYDGNERKGAFLEMLAEYGLEPADPVPIRGDFNYEIALRSFRRWLDRGIPFDAVVAANDESAYACYDAMVERGIKVPAEVSLAGFDDIVNSRFFEVPLTTVKQPIRELASEAIRQLHRMVSGGAPHVDRVFPTVAVIRESCGCFSETARVASGESASGSPEGALPLQPGELRALEDAFRAVRADPDRGGAFIAEFQAFLREIPPGPQSFAASENVVSSLERSLWDGKMDAGMQACETVLHQARILIMQRAEAYQANRGIMYRNRNRRTQYAIAGLMTSFSLDRLLSEIEGLLPSVGIRSCYISLFAPDGGFGRADLVFAHRDGVRIALPPGGIGFAADQYVPRGLIPQDRRFSLCVDTLYYGETLLGLIALDIDLEAGMWSDAVTSLLRGAIRASLLMDELVTKDERLNAAFRELSARACELEMANVRIREDQERLLVSEKMASLGRLTAGIAHEMNTPLATVRASLSEIASLVGEYRDSAGDPEVSREDHLAIAREMERSLELGLRSAERAADFIRGIKGQTRTSDASVPGVAFDLAKTVPEALVLLGPELKRGKCRLELLIPDYPVLTVGKPDRLVQVVTNLIMNAIDAMAPAGGSVALRLSAQGNRAVMTVADSGTGMDGETLKRIFDPLFTTKPFGVGTGLGLTIVHDIITSDFHGTIDVSSIQGKGSTFTVTIPLIKENFNGA